MATIEDVTIDTDDVRIANLTVQDPELAAYLGDVSDEERNDRAARAFQIGAMTLQFAETSTDLEYVKREFERMRGDLEDDIDDVHEDLEDRFDDDGDLRSTLEEYLGDDRELRSRLDEAFGEEPEDVEALLDDIRGDLTSDLDELNAELTPEKGCSIRALPRTT